MNPLDFSPLRLADTGTAWSDHAPPPKLLRAFLLRDVEKRLLVELDAWLDGPADRLNLSELRERMRGAFLEIGKERE